MVTRHLCLAYRLDKGVCFASDLPSTLIQRRQGEGFQLQAESIEVRGDPGFLLGLQAPRN